MTKAEKLQEIILQTNEWFDGKLEQLELLLEKEKESKVFFEGNDGKRMELPAELKKGFFLGLKTAIEVIGEFPIKITKTNDNN